MPETRAFLAAFGLGDARSKGVAPPTTAPYRYAGVAKVRHIPVERYRRYEFPMTLMWTTGTVDAAVTPEDAQRLEALVREQLAQTRVVESQYGNPYDCRIEGVQRAPISTLRPYPRTVALSARGVAVRK